MDTEAAAFLVQILPCCVLLKIGDFCHRHIVGQKAIRRWLPELWGGEVPTANQMSTIGSQNDSRLTQLNNGIGLTDTLTITDILFKNFTLIMLLSQPRHNSTNSDKGAVAQTMLFTTE
ncbi:hypothetical protein H6G97_49845 [Nostoc flagelliforme FACHB-838]|uniref:Transposase n=1 Tax=Nostoc flagelliforme FACHB-838 TaxID=2692904 RepID=A0ABR8E8R1_9NOSO|nr:hypothetical protein [Nostoc flagelliforme]MBD2536895.1 hypothetical protein [Nostoc flagelliforme FACHB-838]